MGCCSITILGAVPLRALNFSKGNWINVRATVSTAFKDFAEPCVLSNFSPQEWILAAWGDQLAPTLVHVLRKSLLTAKSAELSAKKDNT